MWANAQLMVALPYIGGAKMRNLLKVAGVPQTNKTISDAFGPKFMIL